MPDIEDTGRDGYDIRHLIDTVSDAESWAWFLAHACHSIIILPYEPLKGGFDAVEGRDNPEALPPVSRSFHSTDLTEGDR